MRLSERFRRLTLWNKIGLIGAVSSILGIALTIALYILGSQPTIRTTYITNTQISAGQFQRLAVELGVTKAALNSFFKILEQQAIPPEDLSSTLRTIAERYKFLNQKLATFTSDDPTIQSLKEQARKALEDGNFDQAEQLLNEASEKDLQAIQQIQQSTEELETIIQKNKVVIRKRRLSAAAFKAENGELKYTQLAYGEAAAYYQQAAGLVPEDEQFILVKYLNLEGLRWLDAGQYAKAQTPLEHVLGIREKTLGPEHPHVATSLNNLATLYKTQGRYSEPEMR